MTDGEFAILLILLVILGALAFLIYVIMTKPTPIARRGATGTAGAAGAAGEAGSIGPTGATGTAPVSLPNISARQSIDNTFTNDNTIAWSDAAIFNPNDDYFTRPGTLSIFQIDQPGYYQLNAAFTAYLSEVGSPLDVWGIEVDVTKTIGDALAVNFFGGTNQTQSICSFSIIFELVSENIPATLVFRVRTSDPGNDVLTFASNPFSGGITNQTMSLIYLRPAFS